MTLIWTPEKASPSTAIAEISTAPVVSAPLFRSQRALSEKSRRQIFELGRPTLRPGARPSVQSVQASGGSTLYTPARQVVVSWQTQVQRSTTPNQAQSPRLVDFKVNNTPRRLHTSPSAARPVPAQIVIPGTEENSGAAPQLSTEKVPEAMERPAGGNVAMREPRVSETASLAAEAKTVEDITEPRTKPELHHSVSLPMQKFHEGSISARARKQVYMHSTVFDVDGASNSKASIYDPAQQSSVYDKLAPTLRRRVEPPPMEMPTPQEMKLTMVAGHGLHGNPEHWSTKAHQTPRMEKANGKEASGEATLSLPHDPEPLNVVRPRPDDGAIPREIWSNGEAHMNGFDLSVRLRHSPRARSKSADPEGSAENRKQINLSSQIIMSEDATDLSKQQAGKSSSACKEIRSLLNQYMFCMDSALDPHARLERKAQANSARIPQYARDRKSMNLATSDGSQFARPQAAAEAELDLATPAGTDKQLKTLEVLEQRVAAMQNEEAVLVHDDEKRRKNAHFSDLFGLATPRRNLATSPRLSLTEAATFSSLDIGAEVIRKGKRDESLPMLLEPRLHPPTPRSQSELQTHAQERACWDSPKAFDARVEVSRRRRRARAEAKGLFDDVDPHARASSASVRKRLGMASGQMREAMGASAEVWDDGRAGPGPAQPTGIPMRARSCPSSPSAAAFRRIQSTPSCAHPNSARARYIESVLFSDHF